MLSHRLATLVVAALACVATADHTASDGEAGEANTNGVDCAYRAACPDDVYAPVCASDGLTYDSKCAFINAYCLDPSDDFTIVHPGTCADTDLGGEDLSNAPDFIEDPSVRGNAAATPKPKPTPSPTGPPASSSSTISTHLDQFCSLRCRSEEIKPVCGSDGVSASTFVNDCYLLAAKCEQPAMDKLHDGICLVKMAPPASGDLLAGSPMDISEPQGEATATATASGQCNPNCGRVYGPVCGSNGVTYANKCLLEYASCQNPRVVWLADGKCDDLFGADPRGRRAGGSSSSSSPCVPGPCSAVDAPICGSDGHTYLNMCLLRNAQCLHSELVAHHEGACGAHTALTCARMTCPRFTECRDDADSGHSFCADVCAPDRCGPHETCELHDAGECFTAPCSAVATCVPLATDDEVEVQ